MDEGFTMTTMTQPKFIDSPYFVPEFDNWHLKPGAPEEVVKEFEEWLAAYEALQPKPKEVA